MNTDSTQPGKLIPTGDATAILPVNDGHNTPITVIGTEAIRETFDDDIFKQATNSRLAPGVTDVVLNPDAHFGYGVPIGCVLASPTHIYPGPVGVDIKCSMSLLQTDIPASEIKSKQTRRALIDAICDRLPTGVGSGQRHAKRSWKIPVDIIRQGVIEGASPEILQSMGVPSHWSSRCEDSAHTAHDGTSESLAARLEQLVAEKCFKNLNRKLSQLGSLGGGNHFAECEIVHISEDERMRSIADSFGLRDNHVAFMTHCGSRGLGHDLAMGQFRALQNMFKQWSIPYPGNDRELVYAPLGTTEANNYIDDMSIGANFATINHMVINAMVLEAFKEVFPGMEGDLVYFISHNIARKEIHKGKPAWIHRKGATRAMPAGHHELKQTPFYETGHPILLPGDPQRGSAVMVAEQGAELSMYSVNHGAGRVMGRRNAIRSLDQSEIDNSFEKLDILTNCRRYPRDEAPKVYKPFDDVLDSVKKAGLASEVARLQARFVIKDSAKADD